jgi:hypothetical protein
MRTLTLLLALLSLQSIAQPQGYLPPVGTGLDPKVEYRQCGAPARDSKGVIKRSSAVIAAYKRAHPCPSTGSYSSAGDCPGWAIDHIIPLASGGCDSVVNMAWMPNEIKACAEQHCIDRWERNYYGTPHGIITWKPAP